MYLEVEDQDNSEYVYWDSILFQAFVMGLLSLGALYEIFLGGSVVYLAMDVGIYSLLLVGEHLRLRSEAGVLGIYAS